MNPNHYHLLKLIGIAYFNMKNYRNAKEYWEKALSIKPTRTIKRYIEKADYVIKRQNALLGKKQGLEQDPEHLKNQFTLEEELEKI
jgi:tetratricopeptide (TPR) repeat protein